MKRRTMIVSLLGLVLVAGAGFGGYTRGVEAGRAQANDIRQEFYRSRGINPGAGGFAAGGQAGGGQGGGVFQVPAGASPVGGAAEAQAASGGASASGFGAGGPVTFGRIQQVADDSIVVQGREGAVTVKLGEQTAIMRQARTDRSQLKDGLAVTVAGETGADGTITARTVTILGQGGNQGADAAQPNAPSGAAPGGRPPKSGG